MDKPGEGGWTGKVFCNIKALLEALLAFFIYIL